MSEKKYPLATTTWGERELDSILAVLNNEVRRLIPCTVYPFDKRNSARYAPSCPVIPVIRATFLFAIDFFQSSVRFLRDIRLRYAMSH